MKKKRPMTLALRTDITGWLFVLPFVLGFAFFFLVPFAQTVYFSFCQVNLEIGYYDTVWNGWENYIYAFRQDESYMWNFLGSLKQLLYQLPVIFISSLFFAVLLNRKFLGRTFVRAVFFLPVIIASGVVINILKGDIVSSSMLSGSMSSLSGETSIFNSSGLQSLLVSVGMNAEMVEYFTRISNNLFDLMWQTGIQMILFLAGLQSIPSSLYEASSMEGASAWENFWMITVPMLAPVMLVNVVYTIVDSFTNLNNPVMRQIYGQTRALRFGNAAAMSLPYLLAMTVVLGIILWLFSRMTNKRSQGGRGD